MKFYTEKELETIVKQNKKTRDIEKVFDCCETNIEVISLSKVYADMITKGFLNKKIKDTIRKISLLRLMVLNELI